MKKVKEDFVSMKSNLGILEKNWGKMLSKILLNGQFSLIENLLENLDPNLKVLKLVPFVYLFIYWNKVKT